MSATTTERKDVYDRITSDIVAKLEAFGLSLDRPSSSGFGRELSGRMGRPAT